MQALLASLNKTEKILDTVLTTSRTVANLLKVGEMKLKEGKIISNNDAVVFQTIYGDHASVTLATYKKQGSRTPNHCHGGIVEYLIVIQGSFSISVKGGYRVVHRKECFVVKENELHECIALEDNSLLIAVCVPEEPAYKESMSCLPSQKKN